MTEQRAVVLILILTGIGLFWSWYANWQNRRQREAYWRRALHRSKLRRWQAEEARGTVGPGEFRCSACSKVYDKGRSDAEAMAEALIVFGGVINADGPPCIVCDDCYRSIMGIPKDAP